MSNNVPKTDAAGAGAAKFAVPVPNLLSMITETFGFSRTVALVILWSCALLLLAAGVFCFTSNPPGSITMSTGPEGSSFYVNAGKYLGAFTNNLDLKDARVTLHIVASHGSLDNLEKLEDPKSGVDAGFVQGGVTNAGQTNVVSLGSVAYLPLWVFYRGDTVKTLGALAGRRVSVGPLGSGTHSLALSLLATNGIVSGGATRLLEWEATRAASGLKNGTVDAIFLMGEEANTALLRQLLVDPQVQLMNFSQAEAYTRRFPYLSVLKIPEGGFDFSNDIPAQDVKLIGPTVELVARKNLHPALSDLLLQAAQLVNGNPSLLQNKGEFPSPLEHDLKLSDDARRYYKSGSSFFYRYHLPFWLASLMSRVVVVFIPTVLVMVPIIRFIPHMYRWRNQTRIYRWYRALLSLEKELWKEPDTTRRVHLLHRLDHIEREVNKLKVPAFLADQFYGLRGHIATVRALAHEKMP